MKRRTLVALVLSMGLLAVAGCKGDNANKADEAAKGGAEESNTVQIDGSSTVFPITEAVAEEFQKKHDARVTIGVSGTGGGMKKFCRKEVDITGASRPIKPSEVKTCKENGVDYIELPVAYDGITVVVHPKNDWVDQMTVAELKKLWEPAAQGKLKKWSQVRDGWPDEPVHLFGPGIDSGTYDYFTQAVTGQEGASRGDFTNSEDDNVLVQGVSTDPKALGFFGFAYYDENQDKLKAVPVKYKDGDAVLPTVKTIGEGTYQPLSRPLFIYIRKDSAERDIVQKLIKFYTSEAAPLVQEVGFVPLPKDAYEMVWERFESGTTGSAFDGEGSQVGVTVKELLAKEGGEPDQAAGDEAAGDDANADEAAGDEAKADEAAGDDAKADEAAGDDAEAPEGDKK